MRTMAGFRGSPCTTRAWSVDPNGDTAGGWICCPDGRARPASSSAPAVCCASSACRAWIVSIKLTGSGMSGVLARLSSTGASAWAGASAVGSAAAGASPPVSGRRYVIAIGAERSERVRRSIASRRNTSRSSASASVKGTMAGAVPSVSPVVSLKAGVTCPPPSAAPSVASSRSAAAASSAARCSRSCTRAPSCTVARSPAIPSGSRSDSGSVGTVEKHDCTRNAPARMRANTSPPMRVIHVAEKAPAAGGVMRVQFGITVIPDPQGSRSSRRGRARSGASHVRQAAAR